MEMANCSRSRNQTGRAAAAQPQRLSTPEPPVRRWPHPVENIAPRSNGDQDLYYIHCALSYQNQLLADIKTLLQQLCTRQTEAESI